MRSLVLGTANRKKRDELAQLVEPLGLSLRTLADFPHIHSVDETGKTFAENAGLKASGYARQLEQWVLADDSGIAVEALGGAPGVYSARFAGDGASDANNNRLLLEKLSGLPPERRGAHYVCHVALADPAGEIRARSEDYCHGRILEREHGQGGFGYDPMFEIVEYHRTFGQLSPAVKSCLSHRARALRRILPEIARLAAVCNAEAPRSE